MSVSFAPASIREMDGQQVIWMHQDLMEINFARGNALDVLRVLGLPTDELMGEAPAESFLGRVLVALGIEPADEGREAYELQEGEGDDPLTNALIALGTTVYRGSRRPDYLQTRLGELRQLAEYCREHDMLVAWT